MKPEDEDKAKEADNISNGVYWVDGGVLHSSLYWIDSLATYPKKPKEIADKKFVEQKEPKVNTMKHTHADLMAEYAQDAQETDKPWERWEVANAKRADTWENLHGHPEWTTVRKYRRKSTKVKMWQWILKDKKDGAVFITDKFLSEMPTGNEEDDYFEVVGKAEWTEIEV
jgi:hypothetical protein